MTRFPYVVTQINCMRCDMRSIYSGEQFIQGRVIRVNEAYNRISFVGVILLIYIYSFHRLLKQLRTLWTRRRPR